MTNYMKSKTKIIIIFVMVGAVAGLIILDRATSPSSAPSESGSEEIITAPQDTTSQTSQDTSSETISTGPEPSSYSTPKEQGGSIPTPSRESSTGLTQPLDQPGLEYYTIQAGDTLEEISLRFYGSKRGWKRILDANPGLIPTRLKIGKTIVIPPKPSSTIPREVIYNDVYTVVPGDTLITISNKVFGTPKFADQIYQLNRDRIPDPNHLEPDLKLRMPPRPIYDRLEPRGDTQRDTYVVKKGDSLWKIAMKLYGKEAYVQKLWELNKDKLPRIDSLLRVGMVLRLPE
jgi:nucleoid-associated protein YgaU